MRKRFFGVFAAAILTACATAGPGEISLATHNANILTREEIASINVTGDFTIAAGGTCQPGRPFKGESKCTVIVQFRPKAKGARSGTLEFPLAPTMGLVPQKRIALLAGKGQG